MAKQLIVDFSAKKRPIAVFNVTDNEWVNKHELSLAIRAIQKAHKELIRNRRRKRIISEHEASKLKGKNDGTNGSSTASGSDDTASEPNGNNAASNDTAPGSSVDGGTVAADSKSVSGSGSTVEGGQPSGSGGLGRFKT